MFDCFDCRLKPNRYLLREWLWFGVFPYPCGDGARSVKKDPPSCVSGKFRKKNEHLCLRFCVRNHWIAQKTSSLASKNQRPELYTELRFLFVAAVSLRFFEVWNVESWKPQPARRLWGSKTWGFWEVFPSSWLNTGFSGSKPSIKLWRQRKVAGSSFFTRKSGRRPRGHRSHRSCGVLLSCRWFVFGLWKQDLPSQLDP